MFNPSFRFLPEEIEHQADEIIKSPFFKELLQFIPVTLLILNEARQVVFVNKDILESASIRAKKKLTGMRPGECFECIRAIEGIYGCGSTAYCKVCGLANSIENSRNKKEEHEECIIALKDGESLTLNIRSRPFWYKDKEYTFCTVEDNSERKSREMLESIFLHDLKNTSTILSGLQQVYSDMPVEDVRKVLKDVSVRINEEINSYRLITLAENKTLKTKNERVILSDLIWEAIGSLKINPRFSKKEVQYDGDDSYLYTDKTLLRQVVINLIKNAMEASKDFEQIEINHFSDPITKAVCIKVKNKQVMNKDIQLQLFQKSFSTKGTGRGWGSYSIKLLTEKYLKGQVSFVSEEGQGTVFTIEIPSGEPQILTNKAFIASESSY